MRILIVEDDEATRQFIVKGLAALGHQISSSGDGRDGLFQATDGGYDALVVDRLLPGLDGLSLLRMLRAAGNRTPVLMLTAVAGIADRVEGLESGADDYLVKPFAFSELAARVQALGRRPALQAEPQQRLLVGDVELDLARRTVQRAGRKILLQPREFALLAELMRNADRVMTRTMLLERVWDFDFDPRTNIVETHLSRLLRQLVANLLDNALRHTPAGTTISMRLSTAGDHAAITVGDDGPGVSANELPRLFQRFARSERSRHTEGSGLGLALVAAIATAHRGRVSATSDNGFSVTAELPER